MNSIMRLYKKLMEKYGPQGWWPTDGKYHAGDYAVPRNRKERFEICVGAILAQNTAWTNAEKALQRLSSAGMLSPGRLRSAPATTIAKLIRPAGYYNQKTRKLKLFATFYLALKGKTPTREGLLSVWGIGRETADSILLYGYRQPHFIVDAYTKRLLLSMNLVPEKAAYEAIQQLFEQNLPRDITTYQEYHGLIVAHGKKHYRKNSKEKDALLAVLQRGSN